ncbi:MAG: class I SAM-dependent methyltransferase [Chloroflexota bacterium]|nr:class I SAM-dependent methyltransferase [Chloroflexota bacterium]
MNAGHDRLAAMADVTYVEYPQEDLQALSFPDRSFDLVITSDTLEHVPDWRAGLRETQRILRPGGRHVFTVPTRPDLEHTRSRDGMPPIYHGEAPGPLKLVHRATDDNRLLTDFGRDFVPIVAAFGFAVETRGSGVETVFVARKGT